MSQSIKFGTDGWRAIIGETYTMDNVARLSQGLAQWIMQGNSNRRVVIAYDCRFNGRLFAETVARVFIYHEFQVILSSSFVSTPALALSTRDYNADCGIMITASHNPPSYNGYKIKGSSGGPLLSAQLKEIQELIPTNLEFNYSNISLESSFFSTMDIEEKYLESIRSRFNIAAIRNSGLNIVIDSMYGSGQNVWRKLLPEAKKLHAEYNPSFKGIAPEPIEKNLQELQSFLRGHNYDLGIANDGDADRLALFDGSGKYIDSHHVILLLIHYLAGYLKFKGKVVTAFSSVSKISTLCDHYNLDLEVVKIGFNHASTIILKDDVLLAGEESGGIAIKGHVPDRDGIWSALNVLEFMLSQNKGVGELIEEVYDLVGSFYFLREDLKLSSDKKDEIVQLISGQTISRIANLEVVKHENMDGHKFWLSSDTWIMIRPSGTEPVLRFYVEARNESEAQEIMNAGFNFFGLLEFSTRDLNLR